MLTACKFKNKHFSQVTINRQKLLLIAWQIIISRACFGKHNFDEWLLSSGIISVLNRLHDAKFVRPHSNGGKKFWRILSYHKKPYFCFYWLKLGPWH